MGGGRNGKRCFISDQTEVFEHMGAAEISAGGGGENFFSRRGTTKKDSGRGTIFEI